MVAQGKLRQKLTSSVAIAAISALFGGGCALLFGYIVGKGSGSIGAMTRGSKTGVVMVSLLLAGFVALALHELGHLLAGLSVGFQFHIVLVEPDK